MDIDTSGAQGGVVQPISVSQLAHQAVVAQKTEQLSAQGVQFETVNSVKNDVNSTNNASPSNAANVSTSPTYSPSLYAQAAQFQLYTQSGTLASLLAQQGVAPPVDTPYHDDPTEIHAVEGPSASTIDTRA